MRSSIFMVFIAAFGIGAVGWSETVMPENLAPPADVKLAFKGHATGVQIYTCQAAPSDAPYAWVFSASEANLFDETDKPLGTHFAGPTWQAMDGSQVKGKA